MRAPDNSGTWIKNVLIHYLATFCPSVRDVTAPPAIKKFPQHKAKFFARRRYGADGPRGGRHYASLSAAFWCGFSAYHITSCGSATEAALCCANSCARSRGICALYCRCRRCWTAGFECVALRAFKRIISVNANDLPCPGGIPAPAAYFWGKFGAAFARGPVLSSGEVQICPELLKFQALHSRGWSQHQIIHISMKTLAIMTDFMLCCCELL